MRYNYGVQTVLLPNHLPIQQFFRGAKLVSDTNPSSSTKPSKIQASFSPYASQLSSPKMRQKKKKKIKPKTRLTRKATIRVAAASTPKWYRTAKPYENKYNQNQEKAASIFWMIYRGTYIKS